MCAQRQHEASKQTWRNHLSLCKLQIFQRSQSPSKNHFEASNNDSKWRLPFLLNEGYQYICCHHWNNGLYWYEIGYLSHACIQHSKNLVRASKAEVASAHAQQRLGQLRLSGIFGARHSSLSSLSFGGQVTFYRLVIVQANCVSLICLFWKKMNYRLLA